MKRSDYPKLSNPPGSRKLGDWLVDARRALSTLPDEPISSLYALAAHTLQQPAYWPQAHPEYDLNSEQSKTLERQLQLLLAGEPLPYLLGNQAFYGLDFTVNKNVLIPRPETELLVETALRWLAKHPRARLAADVGTGSGCIALSIAKHSPQVKFVATDLSFFSLQVARANRTHHALEKQVDLVQCDLLAGLGGSFDLVCANLPYIPTEKIESLDVARHEPLAALDGGPDGLRLIDRLLGQLKSRLNPDAVILLEMEYSQTEPINLLINRHFPQASVTIMPDLNRLPRLAIIETESKKA
jgi:release factor glutamine methyltransferase